MYATRRDTTAGDPGRRSKRQNCLQLVDSGDWVLPALRRLCSRLNRRPLLWVTDPSITVRTRPATVPTRSPRRHVNALGRGRQRNELRVGGP